MPASSLYSTYILPYRPAGTPPKADIKASGYKKLTAMMKQANKSGVLTTKEVKGELLVMSVNGEHAECVSDTRRKSAAMLTGAPDLVAYKTYGRTRL